MLLTSNVREGVADIQEYPVLHMKGFDELVSHRRLYTWLHVNQCVLHGYTLLPIL